jgi:hypothetical protein
MTLAFAVSSMVNPLSHQTHEYRGYLQALDNFGITQLVLSVKTASKPVSLTP